ncbi:MAG: UvrD-helicase domain-containing protein [Candidatus Velthaea sp.]
MRDAVTILSSTNFEMTDEQREVIAAAKHGETFAVRAFAGSGKTSTLRAIGSELSGKRVLYLAFNRDIVREGKAFFPATTKVATGHGFARSVLAGRFAGKIDDSVPTLESRVRTRLGLSARHGDMTDARELLAARIGESFAEFSYDATTAIGAGEDEEAAEHARAIWTEIQASRAIHPSDHDLYVKLLFVLQTEQGHPQLGFDTILYDECQDCTGSMFGTVRGQRRTQQIYMGDPAQGIYAFRGATNAFLFLDDLAYYSLTTSFRFGLHIAALAERILDASGTHLPIRVLPRRTDRVVTAHEQCPDPSVILTRSQQQVLDTALGEHTRGRKVAIVGNLEASRLQQLATLAADVFALREGQQPARLAKFSSFQTLKWYAEKKHAPQLKIAVSLVERFGDRVSDLLETLRNEVVPQDKADVIVSTAHAFKGRQGARVSIAGDFRPFATADPKTPGKFSVDRQELHLAYVTVTRAQRVLDIADFREPLLASLLAVGAHASFTGIVEEPKKLETGITKVPRALLRLVGNAGNLHAPEASIRVAVPSRSARAEKELAAVSARLSKAHRKPVASTPVEGAEFVGTFLEALPVSVTAGYAFIDGDERIGIVPIDGSTLRTANVLRGKRVIARNASPDPAWTLRVTAG